MFNLRQLVLIATQAMSTLISKDFALQRGVPLLRPLLTATLRERPKLAIFLFGKQYLQVIALSVEDAVDIDLLVKTVKREIVATDHEPVIGAQGID